MNLPDDQVIITTLRKHSAYVTQTRISVLKVLSQSRSSISLSHIRKLSPVALDRVSVYRTLQLFLKKGLIQTVPNSKGNCRYILKEFLNRSSSPSASHFVHFICNNCGYTELIEQAVPLVFDKPGNHQVNNCYILLEGICSECGIRKS